MKKLLNTIYVLNDKLYLSLDGENFVALQNGEEKLRVPMCGIEDIVSFSYVGVSPALMAKCFKNNIHLSFISPFGKIEGRITGQVKGNVCLRIQQIDKFRDNAIKIKLIQNCIATKFNNALFLLKRTKRDRNLADNLLLKNVISNIESAINDVYSIQDEGILRGIEGKIANEYFDVFNLNYTSQNDAFKFTTRSKHPPRDRINAILSFMYAIVTNEIASSLEAVGLDPYIGFFHTVRSGRVSLACDIVEEFRAMIDRFVITLINLKIVNSNDFDVEIGGAMLLNDSGRKKVLSEWQSKKRESVIHPFLNEKVCYGLFPYIQANLLAKFIRGEISEYPTLVLR